MGQAPKLPRLRRFYLQSRSWKNSSFPALYDLGLKLIFFAVGAVATYYVAPAINEHFEQERRRTIYYTDAIQALSGDTKEFLARFTTFAYDDGSQKDDTRKTTIELRELLTKLHWRAIEYALVFNDQKFRTLITEYQVSLENLSEILKGKNVPEDKRAILLGDFADRTARIVSELAHRADAGD